MYAFTLPPGGTIYAKTDILITLKSNNLGLLMEVPKNSSYFDPTVHDSLRVRHFNVYPEYPQHVELCLYNYSKISVSIKKGLAIGKLYIKKIHGFTRVTPSVPNTEPNESLIHTSKMEISESESEVMADNSCSKAPCLNSSQNTPFPFTSASDSEILSDTTCTKNLSNSPHK